MRKFLSLLLVVSLMAEATDPKVGGGTVITNSGMAGGVQGGFGGMQAGMGNGGMGMDQGFSNTGMGDTFNGGVGMQGGFVPPRRSSPGSLNLPAVDMNSRLCSFGMGDEVSQDDRLLLTNARSMADALRNNSEQCRQATQQNFDAFNQSVQDFNNFNDTSRPLNPDTPVQASCSNYERFYDIQYDQFVNTWENAGVRDMFASCRGQPREEAFSCAQDLISTARIQKQNTCETSQEFISAQRASQLQVDTLRTGVDILTAMLNNDQCLGDDPNQRMNVVQSAVSLASRAAMLSVVGSPLALGIGAVTNLLQSAIGRLFRRGSRDPYLADQNQQNFERVACLYEQVESRARRCDRDAAEQYVARERGRYDDAVQACEQMGNVQEPMNLFRDISSVIGELQPRQTAAAPAPGQSPPPTPQRPGTPFAETFNALMERLVTPTSQFGSGSQTPLNVGLQSADDVIRNIDLMLSDDTTNLDTYMRAKYGEQTPITQPARNRERARLREEKARAESVKNLLTVMDQVGNSANQSEGDLRRAEEAMRNFQAGSLNGNPLNFAGAFNQVLSMRGELTDDLGNRINTWRNRLSEFQLHSDVIQRFNQNVARTNSPFNDGGAFQNQVNTLRPYLRDQMETELRRLARNAGAVVQDNSRENVTNARSTTAENILWPMVRACNLLQSVGGDRDNVCAQLSCQNGSGVKTFAQYLAQRNGNRNCTPENCPAEYNTFICQNKGTGVTHSIGDRLKNEYVSNGTICGRPWNEVFRR